MRDSDIQTTSAADAHFDWLKYADATFAGLSLLIPIIGGIFEWFFRRRIPQAIARRNGRTLSRETVRRLNQSKGCMPGCFLWPVMAVIELLKLISRTILYFFTVKEASDQLSYYWHRAFLIDYSMRQGRLEDDARPYVAILAIHTVLDQTTTSPLNQLAEQVLKLISHVFRSALRWLRLRREDSEITTIRSYMEEVWSEYNDYFILVATQYDQVYAQLAAAPPEEPA